MRKLIALTLALLLLLPGMAYADVLWEPYEDSFYMSHKSKCVSQQPARSYLPKEGAPLYPAPDQPASGHIQGEVSIPWLYTATDGSQWGLALQHGDSLGWVNLYDMQLIYDNISFAADHADEITEESVYVKSLCPDGFIFWSYPLSGRQHYKFEADYGYDGMLTSQTYTDPDGRLWGYVGYWRGRHNAWICLSDPLNGQLGIPEETDSQPRQDQLMDTGAPSYQPPSGMPLPLLSLSLGGGAAVIAALLIRHFGKKKR